MSAAASASKTTRSTKPILRRAPRGRKPPDGITTPFKPDRRTIVGRRADEFRRELIEHLGGSPSVTETAMVEIAVALKMRLIVFDILFTESEGEPPNAHDSERYLAWANSLSRVLVKLGLKASPKPKQSLADYMSRAYGSNGSTAAVQPRPRPHSGGGKE